MSKISLVLLVIAAAVFMGVYPASAQTPTGTPVPPTGTPVPSPTPSPTPHYWVGSPLDLTNYTASSWADGLCPDIRSARENYWNWDITIINDSPYTMVGLVAESDVEYNGLYWGYTVPGGDGHDVHTKTFFSNDCSGGSVSYPQFFQPFGVLGGGSQYRYFGASLWDVRDFLFDYYGNQEFSSLGNSSDIFSSGGLQPGGLGHFTYCRQVDTIPYCDLPDTVPSAAPAVVLYPVYYGVPAPTPTPTVTPPACELPCPLSCPAGDTCDFLCPVTSDFVCYGADTPFGSQVIFNYSGGDFYIANCSADGSLVPASALADVVSYSCDLSGCADIRFMYGCDSPTPTAIVGPPPPVIDPIGGPGLVLIGSSCPIDFSIDDPFTLPMRLLPVFGSQPVTIGPLSAHVCFEEYQFSDFVIGGYDMSAVITVLAAVVLLAPIFMIIRR